MGNRPSAHREWRPIFAAAVLAVGMASTDAASAAGITCDFDANGYEDVAVGAIKHRPDSTPTSIGSFSGAGEIHVLYGAVGGFTGRPAQRFDESSFVSPGPQRSGLFGFAVDCGDYDGDGFDDLAVSRPLFDEERPLAGRVWILFGSTNGLGTRFAEVQAPTPTRFFGMSLASGDFNADGYDDLVVGSPMQPVNGYCSGLPELRIGVLHVYWGHEGGLSLLHALQLNRDDPGLGLVVDCDEFSNPWNAERYNGRDLGRDLVSGDFDTDGTMDLAVVFTRPRLNYETPEGGWIVLYGFPGLVPAYGGPGFDFDRRMQRVIEEPGRYARIEAGDFNGDGRDDIVLSSNHEGSDGLSKVHVWYQKEDADFELRQQFTAGEGLGASLAAGDFDGDDCEDLALGAPTATVDEVVEAGTVYVYPCVPDAGLDDSQAQQLKHYKAPSIWGFERLGWAMTAGNFFAGGEADLVVGAPGYLVDAFAPDGGALVEYQGSPGGLGGGAGLPEYRWVEDDPLLPGFSDYEGQFGWGLRSSFPCLAGLPFIGLQCLPGGVVGPLGVPPI